MCFLNSAEKANLEQTALLPLENRKCRKYSFQKLTQFTEGNKVLDLPASNTNVFLWRDICVSSTQPNRPTWN
jgi:hypothetical protein